MMAAIRPDQQGQDLQTLFAGFADIAHMPQMRVSGLALDSRTIQPGDLFLACAGTSQHGLHFIDSAIANGAVAVALEPASDTEGLDPNSFSVPVFWVERLHWVASEVAGRFYGNPSEKMKVVGITGTNGKTSISQFIAQAISQDCPCGVVGTLGSGLYGKLDTTGLTTPDAVSLQRQLAEMLEAGADHVVMEVSSHALDQGRVNGVRFDAAVYTNLSHEHLDYHGDMLSYAGAKRRLLEMPGLQQAVINADDATGREWLAAMPAGVEAMSFGIAGGEGEALKPTLFADELELDATGLSMQVHLTEQHGTLQTGLLGRFNASNLLAALGALLALGYEFGQVMDRLTRVTTVPGRMEAFGGQDKPLVVVDYAHTPDALEHVLTALREHTARQLWCIFGCGGERDREKRPMMGKIAEQLADNVVITDDNPRRENPFSIIEDIICGIENPDAVYINRDRAQAIAHAIGLSRASDVILVAGKGHETEQKIGDRSIPYSDRSEVALLLGEEVRNG
jgi:UDP-N-acetylmuramoyl-L-alanyl-D-glutamate--2,6-diaminopimelate ligase